MSVATLNEELAQLVLSHKSVELLRPRVEEVVVGVFYTGVRLDTGHAGVAFTPVSEMPPAVCCPKSNARMPLAGKLTQLTLEELVWYATDRNPLKSAIGVATINALSHLIMEQQDGQYSQFSYGDALDLVTVDPDDRVVMIGAFPPFIKRLKQLTRVIDVLERNPRALDKGELVELRSADEAPDLVPLSDILIVSGSAIVNHTLESILMLAKSAKEIVVVGPTASMIPDPLFRRNVTVLGGIRVYDSKLLMLLLREGGSGYDFFESCAHKIALRAEMSLV